MADRGFLLVAGALVAVALVPFLFMGPGTDLDAGAVIRSGRAIIEDLRYTPSRAPGAPVHETGGRPARADRRHGRGEPRLAARGHRLRGGAGRAPPPRGRAAGPAWSTAVVVANPWFLIAATSTVDFLWALALLLAAAWLLRTDRAVLAGLAAGARHRLPRLRPSRCVACLVVAELLDQKPEARRRALRHGARSRPPARSLVFVPSFRASGDSLAFAQNDVPTSSFLVQLGRFAVKDLYLVGPFAAVVLLALHPGARPHARPAAGRLDRALRRARPARLAAALPPVPVEDGPPAAEPRLPRDPARRRVWRDRPGLLAALVVAQLLYVVVNVQLVRPDVPNAATTGRLTFDPAWGALVVDTQCRRDDPNAWESVDPARVEAVWTCAKPWAVSD